MNNAKTVRVAGLAAVTGCTIESIGNRIKLGQLPFVDPPKAKTAQRRYDAGQALALVVQESFMAQGLTAFAAAETIRGQANVLDLFLDEIEAGASVTPRFVADLRELQSDSLTGQRWTGTDLCGYGTAEEIADLFRAMLARAGKTQDRGKGRKLWNVSGPWVAVQSLPAAWSVLEMRAMAAGYIIKGRGIMRASGEADE